MQALGYERAEEERSDDCWFIPRLHETTVCALAAFGWQASPDSAVLKAPDGSVSSVLHCALCLRTCGSWNYKKQNTSTDTSSSSSQSAATCKLSMRIPEEVIVASVTQELTLFTIDVCI